MEGFCTPFGSLCLGCWPCRGGMFAHCTARPSCCCCFYFLLFFFFFFFLSNFKLELVGQIKKIINYVYNEGEVDNYFPCVRYVVFIILRPRFYGPILNSAYSTLTPPYLNAAL